MTAHRWTDEGDLNVFEDLANRPDGVAPTAGDMARSGKKEGRLMLTGCYVLDDKGEPVPEPDPIAFSRFYQDMEKRRVAETWIGDTRVSTVFLGVDHNCTGQGPPALFETMVFDPLDSDLDLQDHYATREEAIIGHEAFVARLQSGKGGTR